MKYLKIKLQTVGLYFTSLTVCSWDIKKALKMEKKALIMKKKKSSENDQSTGHFQSFFYFFFFFPSPQP